MCLIETSGFRNEKEKAGYLMPSSIGSMSCMGKVGRGERI